MSHTNQTANYHLPQFIGTDKPAWLVDFNQAMSDIDTQMKANETASGTAEADAQSALSGVTALNSQVGGIQTSVTALETQAPLDEAQIETNRQNIATNAQNIVDLDNRMGHTSISGIGDGSATGAIKAVDDKVGDLADLDTTDKSSIVDAINEVVAGGAGVQPTVRYYNNYIQYTDDNGVTWYNALRVGHSLTPIDTSNMSASDILQTSGDTAVITKAANGAFHIQANAGHTGVENPQVFETVNSFNLVEGAVVQFNGTVTLPANAGTVTLKIKKNNVTSSVLITGSGSYTIPAEYANTEIKFVVTGTPSGYYQDFEFSIVSN